MTLIARLVVGLLIVLITLSSSPPTRAESSDSDIAALRREMKALAEKNQKQIDALERQVRDLKGALAKSRTAPPSRAALAAAPAAPGAMASAEPGAAAPNGAPGALPVAPKPMEYVAPTTPPMLPPQMLDLPGRSVTPPYTGTGPGTPGAAPVTPAAAMSSGGNRIALSLSGQVNRALLYGDDGLNAKLRNVDNNNSSTRFRIVGEARPLDDTVAGMNLEVEVRANSSANQTLTQNLPQAASTVSPTIRQAEIYGGNPNYGELRLGFGSTASYLTAEVDLSGTAVASYVLVSDFDGGFAFRQKGAAMVPGGAGGALVLAPANSFGPAVASVFNYFDGLGRDDRIRYDTPVWNGWQFATSLIDGGAFDLAARYARQYEDFQIVGGMGLGFATARNRPQPAFYGYAGVPAGFGGTSLAGTNAAPNSPTTADVNPDKSTQFDGSVSVLLKSGLNLTIAGGVRDPHYTDPAGRRLSPNLIYVKLGQQFHFFPIGMTAFSVDFVQNEELIFNNDAARAYSVAAVQDIDDFGLELFLAGKYQTLDRTFASYRPIVAIMSGGRVRF